MTLTLESAPAVAPARRVRRRWLFGVAAGVWAVIASSMVLGLTLPKVPGPVLVGLAISAYSFNLYLLVPAVLGGLLAWWGRRTGRRRSVAAAVLSALLVVGVAVPSWRLWRAAAAHDVSLSLSGYFGGPDGGASAPAATETYATVDGVQLKVDVWQPPGAAPGPRPAMIYVFGGGWVTGDRKQMPAYFQWLTSRGLTVFAIDYRLATPGHPVWDKAPGDVKCAVGWVRANAARHGIDPDRIVLSGNSAGGNLAMLAAYTAGDQRVPASCATADTSVRAVVEFYGPTDLTAAYREADASDTVDRLESYLGGAPADQADRYSRNSPVSYVRPGLPPTLLLHGDRDSVVPAAQATELAGKLTAAGVPNTVVMFPATEHSFDGLYGGFATQITRPVITRFLRQHVTN